MICLSGFAWFNRDTLKDIWVPLMQVFGPFLAATLVLVQINRNHQNNIRLQGEKTKDELKTKLHTEIEEKLQVLSDALSEANNLFNRIGFTFSAIRGRQINPQFPFTTPDIIGFKAAVINAAIGVILVIEKYEIIEPEIKIFQTALNVYMHNLNQADMHLFTELMAILPIDIVEPAPVGFQAGTRVHRPLPDEATMQRIERLSEPYKTALSDISCVIHDFRIDIQNLLLGHLFNRKISPRKPLDPRMKVVTTDPKTIETLKRYFNDETPWGRNRIETEARVTQDIANQMAAQNTAPEANG